MKLLSGYLGAAGAALIWTSPLLVTPTEAHASTEAHTPTACGIAMDLASPDSVSRWQTILDGVMGGRSTGTRYAEDDYMVFRGVINTNGGGFSSIRMQIAPGSIDGIDSIKLRMRQDDRQYKLTFRTDQRYWGRPVSFEAPIPKTEPGEWREVIVPISTLRSSVFGQPVPVNIFRQGAVREIGIILADGKDGAFRLEVSTISCAVNQGDST